MLNGSKELGELGDIYAENTQTAIKAKTASIGDADLQPGGADSVDGVESDIIDVDKTTNKNEYQSKRFSSRTASREAFEEDEEEKLPPKATKAGGGKTAFGKAMSAGEDPDPKDYNSDGSLKKDEDNEEPSEDNEEPSEDNEEKSDENEKVTEEKVNSFMANKSIFDKLYENVMFGDDDNTFGDSESNELEALGIDETDETDDAVSITLPRDVAKQLYDKLGEMLDSEDESDADLDDVELGDDLGGDSFEEDEEAFAQKLSTSYNDGKGNNSVGSVTKSSSSASSGSIKDTSGKPTKQSTSYNDGSGKNVVGKLKKGQNAFD